MWFKKTSVQLSASVVSALYAKNCTTACIFFVMGVFERMKENEEEERKGYVDECISKVNEDLQEQISSCLRYSIDYSIENFNKTVELSDKFNRLVKTLNSIKNQD